MERSHSEDAQLVHAVAESRVNVAVLEDRTSHTPSDQGFITVRRLTLEARFEDGRKSEPFRYDVVDRAAIDAVVIVLTATDLGHDEPFVCLRTALRPPIALRAGRALARPETPTALLWELPAGLIEPEQTSDLVRDAVRETAARECREETGYAVPSDRFTMLGPAVFLSPGLCAEKIYFVHAWVDRNDHRAVTSTEIVEQPSEIAWVPLGRALSLAEQGVIQDCKTELALRRLKDRLEHVHREASR